MLLSILTLLVPVAAGKLTEWLTDLLKMIGGYLADTPAWAKQGVALTVAAGLAWAAAFFSAPQILAGEPGVIVNALLAWAIAMLFHNGKRIARI